MLVALVAFKDEKYDDNKENYAADDDVVEDERKIMLEKMLSTMIMSKTKSHEMKTAQNDYVMDSST